MEELIRRLSILVEGIGLAEEVRPGTTEYSMLSSKDWTRIRGIHDVLLAMEERVETIRTAESRGIVHRDLWERA